VKNLQLVLHKDRPTFKKKCKLLSFFSKLDGFYAAGELCQEQHYAAGVKISFQFLFFKLESEDLPPCGLVLRIKGKVENFLA
jgi:hypothetical protein